MCETAGSPPGLFYTLMLVAPYGLSRLGALATRWRGVSWKQLAVCLAVAAAIAGARARDRGLAGAPACVFGSRERGGRSGEDFALALSAPWREVIRGVVARGAGLQEMHMGSVGDAARGVRADLRGRASIAASRSVMFVIAAFGVALCVRRDGRGAAVVRAPRAGLRALAHPGPLQADLDLGARGDGGIRRGCDRRALAMRSACCVGADRRSCVYLISEYAQPASSTAREAWWSIAAISIAAAIV